MNNPKHLSDIAFKYGWNKNNLKKITEMINTRKGIANMLSDDIIDYYANVMNVLQRINIYMFSSQLFTFNDVNHEMNRSADTRKSPFRYFESFEYFDGLLSENDLPIMDSGNSRFKIFIIPIHTEEHWSLLVFFRDEPGVLYHYDSIEKYHSNRVRDILNIYNRSNVLGRNSSNNECPPLFTRKKKSKNIKIISVSSMPQQEKGWECGWYLLLVLNEIIGRAKSGIFYPLINFQKSSSSTDNDADDFYLGDFSRLSKNNLYTNRIHELSSTIRRDMILCGNIYLNIIKQINQSKTINELNDIILFDNISLLDFYGLSIKSFISKNLLEYFVKRLINESILYSKNIVKKNENISFIGISSTLEDLLNSDNRLSICFLTYGDDTEITKEYFSCLLVKTKHNNNITLYDTIGNIEHFPEIINHINNVTAEKQYNLKIIYPRTKLDKNNIPKYFKATYISNIASLFLATVICSNCGIYSKQVHDKYFSTKIYEQEMYTTVSFITCNSNKLKDILIHDCSKLYYTPVYLNYSKFEKQSDKSFAQLSFDQGQKNDRDRFSKSSKIPLISVLCHLKMNEKDYDYDINDSVIINSLRLIDLRDNKFTFTSILSSLKFNNVELNPYNMEIESVSDIVNLLDHMFLSFDPIQQQQQQQKTNKRTISHIDDIFETVFKFKDKEDDKDIQILDNNDNDKYYKDITITLEFNKSSNVINQKSFEDSIEAIENIFLYPKKVNNKGKRSDIRQFPYLTSKSFIPISIDISEDEYEQLSMVYDIDYIKLKSACGVDYWFEEYKKLQDFLIISWVSIKRNIDIFASILFKILPLYPHYFPVENTTIRNLLLYRKGNGKNEAIEMIKIILGLIWKVDDILIDDNNNTKISKSDINFIFILLNTRIIVFPLMLTHNLYTTGPHEYTEPYNTCIPSIVLISSFSAEDNIIKSNKKNDSVLEIISKDEWETISSFSHYYGCIAIKHLAHVERDEFEIISKILIQTVRSKILQEKIIDPESILPDIHSKERFDYLFSVFGI